MLRPKKKGLPYQRYIGPSIVVMAQSVDKYRTRLDAETHMFFEDRTAWVGEHLLAEDYNDRGYTVIPALVDVDNIAPLDGQIWKNVSFEKGGGLLRSALQIHEHPPVSQLVRRLAVLAESVLGGDSYIHQSRINFKYPGASGWSWHSDFETWHSQDGMPVPNCFSLMIALDDNTEENAPLIVIPSSHKWYWPAPRPCEVFSPEENFTDQKEGVPPENVIEEMCARTGSEPLAIMLKAGDALLFDSNLMHMSRANSSARSRRNLYLVFNRKDNALLEPYSYNFKRPEYMANRGRV